MLVETPQFTTDDKRQLERHSKTTLISDRLISSESNAREAVNSPTQVIRARMHLNLGDSLIVAVGMSGSGMMKADAVGRIVAAAQAGKETATLYGGKHFKVARLGIETRQVEPEGFVI